MKSVKNVQVNIVKHVLGPKRICLYLVEKFLKFLRIIELSQNVLVGLLRAFEVDLCREKVSGEGVVHVLTMGGFRVQSVVLVENTLNGGGVLFYCDTWEGGGGREGGEKR